MIEPIEKIEQKELLVMLGKGRTALYHLRNKDATFPKPIDHQPLRWALSGRPDAPLCTPSTSRLTFGVICVLKP